MPRACSSWSFDDSMLVRKAARTDFIEIHKLILLVFPDADAKMDGNDEFFVAEEGGSLVGFAHFSEDEKKILLNGFGVVQARRGKGAGGAILDTLLAYADGRKKSVYAKARLGSDALRLYCRKGFCMKRLKGRSVTLVFRNAN